MIPKLIKMSRSSPWKPEGARAFTDAYRASQHDGVSVLICDRRNRVFGNFVSDVKDKNTAYMDYVAWMEGAFNIWKDQDSSDRLRYLVLSNLQHFHSIKYLACWCGDWEYGEQSKPYCHVVHLIRIFAENYA